MPFNYLQKKSLSTNQPQIFSKPLLSCFSISSTSFCWCKMHNHLHLNVTLIWLFVGYPSGRLKTKGDLRSESLLVILTRNIRARKIGSKPLHSSLSESNWFKLNLEKMLLPFFRNLPKNLCTILELSISGMVFKTFFFRGDYQTKVSCGCKTRVILNYCFKVVLIRRFWIFNQNRLCKVWKYVFENVKKCVIKNFNIFQKNSVYQKTFYLHNFILLASTSLQNL